MLKEGLLEMRLVVVKNTDGRACTAEELNNNGIFHQKVGILQDEAGNKLSFSGSINESATAWIHNDEEFKVFGDWTSNADFTRIDQKRFEDYWNVKKKNVIVFNLPQAVKKNLIDYACDFDIDSISLHKYQEQKREKIFPSSISLFPYQREALKKWKESNYQMLFEMATGTGKTRTAIAGMKYLLDKLDRLVVVIACPQTTLSSQWKKEIENLNVGCDEMLFADGNHSRWREELRSLLSQNRIGLCDHIIIFTTHRTASSDDFVRLMTAKHSDDSPILFIGDEVHWLGAGKYRDALLPIYRYRIGLSATPSRWYDDEGTEMLEQYFNHACFEFTIHDALTTINPLTGKHFLVNYRYHVIKVRLNEDETAKYQKLTQRIVKAYQAKKNNPEASESYEKLVEQRANIIKNAEAKYEELSGLLDEMKSKGELEDLIIFVSPEQKDEVLDILSRKDVLYHKLTENESTKADKRYGGLSERDMIIQQFKNKEYKVLVAIKCLDEGIDIPSASRGILLANSTNPREYIQRIGRIIRQDRNKTIADLYDFVVASIHVVGDNMDMEKSIRGKERLRMMEIAKEAINMTEATTEIINI